MILDDLKVGLLLGACFAIAYSIVATMLVVLAGDEAFGGVGWTFEEVLYVYWVGFLSGGVLVGALWRIRARRLGAVAIGWVGLLPLFFVISLNLGASGDSFLDHALVATIGSGIVGGGAGLVAWYEEYGE